MFLCRMISWLVLSDKSWRLSVFSTSFFMLGLTVSRQVSGSCNPSQQCPMVLGGTGVIKAESTDQPLWGVLLALDEAI